MAGTAEFDVAWRAEFLKIVGKQDAAALTALHAELVEIGARHRRVIENTPCDLPGAPFNKTLTQRIAWLDANILTPAERLASALTDEQQAMFSTWPYENEFPSPLDRQSVGESLNRLVTYADRLKRNLIGERDADAGTNQEIRAAIFYDISDAMQRHLPNVKPTRGVYDRGLKRYVGIFSDAIRHIYQEITGLDEQLARLIRSART